MSMTNGVLERSFQAELRDVMERHVDDEMLVGSAGRLTGGEVLRRCEAIRDELLFAGLDVGEYVACAGNGDIDMMIASMGIMLAGGIPLPMQLFREVESWSVGLAQSHARFLVAEEPCERLVADVMRGFGIEPAVVLIALDGSVLHPRATSSYEDVEVDPANIGMVRFTSGSTGVPKGILMSYAAVFYNIAASQTLIGYRDNGRYLNVVPSCDYVSLVFSIAALMRDEVAVFCPSMMPAADEVVGVLEQERITDMLMITPQLLALAESGLMAGRDVSHLQRILYAGQAVTVPALRRLISVMPCELAQFYASTEAGILAGLTAQDHKSDDDRILSSAGRPFDLAGTRVAIRNPATGCDVAQGEIGHIMVSGPGVCPCKLGSDEPFDMVDGWRDMLDLGVIDEDGYLSVKGRTRDVVMYRGSIVYAQAVEERIANVPGVCDVCVHPVTHSADGERTFAWVVPDQGVSLDPNEIMECVEASFGWASRPAYIEFIDELPKMGSLQKVDKRGLRARAEQMLESWRAGIVD